MYQCASIFTKPFLSERKGLLAGCPDTSDTSDMRAGWVTNSSHTRFFLSFFFFLFFKKHISDIHRDKNPNARTNQLRAPVFKVSHCNTKRGRTSTLSLSCYGAGVTTWWDVCNSQTHLFFRPYLGNTLQRNKRLLLWGEAAIKSLQTAQLSQLHSTKTGL